MTRFINTALIALSCFVLFLAVLWLVVDPKAPGLDTQSEGGTAVSVRSTKVTWDESAPGQRMGVDVLLRNQGAAGTLTQVAYRATLDGAPLASGTTSPPISIPAGLDVPLHFTIDLPPDTATRWLRAVQAGEPLQLKVDGSLAVRTAAADQRVPFSWSVASDSHLLEHLADAPQECPGPPAPLCLKDLDAELAGGRMQASLGLRNDQGDPLRVRNGTFRLVFEDVTVATGRLEGDLEIAPGEAADLKVSLAFDDQALRQWWAGHAGHCEVSRLAFAVGLEVDTVGGPSAVDWELLASPLQTGLLCRGSD